MSLRNFHALFILIAMVLVDMFGAWAIWDHAQSHNKLVLAVGIVSFLIGFGLAGYAIWFVRKLDRANVT